MHAPADWYPDPTDRHEQRWWDGRSWSEHVYTGGVQSVDPLSDSVVPSLDDEDDESDERPDQHEGVSQDIGAEVLQAHVDAIDFFTPRRPSPPMPPVPSRATAEPVEQAAMDASAPDEGQHDDPDDLDDLAPWSMSAEEPVTPSAADGPFGIAGDVFVMSAATVHDLTARRQAATAGTSAVSDEEDEHDDELVAMREPSVPEPTEPDSGADDAPLPPDSSIDATPAAETPADAGDTSRPEVIGLGAGDPLGIRGAILGDHDVVTDTRVRVDNRRLLRCTLDDRSGAVARLGTVVATQGVIDLSVVGATRWAHRKLAPSLPLVRTTGTGDVFFADDSQHVTLLQLSGRGGGLVTRAEALLAFDGMLGWGVEHAGEAEIAPDLLTVQVHGDGWIALLSDGEPIALPTQGKPTFVDLHALVAWSGALRMRVLRSGPTQDVQVAFEGHGVVIVQPSPGNLPD